MEARCDVPVLVVLEGEDIHQQLEVPHLRLALHGDVAVDLIAGEGIENLGHLVDATIGHLSVLVERLHIEVHVMGGTEHGLEASPEAHHFADRRRHIHTNAGSAERNAQVQVPEGLAVVILCPTLQHAAQSQQEYKYLLVVHHHFTFRIT